MASATQLDSNALSEFGLERLLAAAGALVTDNTPDARTAAKQLLPIIRTSFTATAGISDESVSVDDAKVATQKGLSSKVADADPPQHVDAAESQNEPTAWESFVHENSSASAALALLKISTD